MHMISMKFLFIESHELITAKIYFFKLKNKNGKEIIFLKSTLYFVKKKTKKSILCTGWTK